MHKKIIIPLISTLSLSILPAQSEIITTSNGHVYSIAPFIVDQSRALTEMQLLEKSNKSFHPISLQVKKKSFDLFCDACHASDSFDDFYYALSAKKQSLLTAVAGEQELNSPSVTLNILNVNSTQSVMTSNLRPYLETDMIMRYIYNKIVKKKAEKKTKKQVFSSKKKSFKANHCISFGPSMESFSFIPKTLINNGKFLFHGNIQPKDNLQFLVPLRKHTEKMVCAAHMNNNANPRIEYFLTFTNKKSKKKQTTQEKKQRFLITFNEYDHIIHTQTITHPNNISQTLFSPNVKHLVTYSEASDNFNYPTLMITALATDKASDYTNMLLPLDSTHCITRLCFNPQSTLLAIGIKKYNNDGTITAHLEFWDPSSVKLITTINNLGQNITMILFNQNGTRMFVVAKMKQDIYKYILYNTEDIYRIPIMLLQLKNNPVQQKPQFNHQGNILVMLTKNGSMNFINCSNGQPISEKYDNRFCNAITNIVFSPDDTFCLTATTQLTKKNNDCVCLWDATTGSLLRHILTDKNNIRGIGLSPNSQYAVTTFDNFELVETALVDSHTIQCMQWTQKHASLPQLYAIYHTYQAHLQKRRPNDHIMNILEKLPTSPCNIKKFIHRHLLYHHEKMK